jgi:uncharacterized protein YqgC (DUF456 family)
MEYVFIVIGPILIIAGIIGSVAPGLPGPPLSYLGLIMLELATGERIFSTSFLIVMAVITLAVTIIENLLPILGAKVSGASKAGIWGAVIGLIIGSVFFPPLGLIFGVLIGAIAGEILAGRSGGKALKAGLATFFGNVLSIIVKLALAGFIAYYFFTGWL